MATTTVILVFVFIGLCFANPSFRINRSLYETSEEEDYSNEEYKDDKLVENDKDKPVDKRNTTAEKRPEHKWVDWKPRTRMPDDAIIIGYTQSECDGSDVPIYLGKAFFEETGANGATLPVAVLEYEKYVKASFGSREHQSTKGIQILCSKDHAMFTWVLKNQNNYFSYRKDCLKAGSEVTYDLFFARAVHDDEFVIGKYVPDLQSMYFPYMGKEMKLTSDYEILCFKHAIAKEKASSKEDEDTVTESVAFATER